MAAYRAAVEASMRKRVERGIREGELPADTDAGGLAKFYETVIQGMSSQALDGATRKSLRPLSPMQCAPGLRKGQSAGNRTDPRH